MRHSNRGRPAVVNIRADFVNRATPLKRDDAIKFQKLIEDMCEQNNAYCVSTHERKPDLKGIKLEVSIKVEPTTTIRREG